MFINQMLNEDFSSASLYIVAGSTGQLLTTVGHEFKNLWEDLTMLRYCLTKQEQKVTVRVKYAIHMLSSYL